MIQITELESRTQGQAHKNIQGQGHKRKCFPKKKGLFRWSQKNGLEKHCSADLQNFNHLKNSVVLEPRTGQISRT